jgi:hypothetical protein
MREELTISGIRKSVVGDAAYQRLCELFPRGYRPTPAGEESYWWIVGPPEAPAVSAAISVLLSAGFRAQVGIVGRGDPGRPPSDCAPQPEVFYMHIERCYSTRDLAACEHLELLGYRYYHMIPHRDPPQDLWITPKTARSKADFIQSDTERTIIVPQRVREALEAGDLRHLQFRSEVHVSRELVGEKRREIPWSKFPERWYELWSDLILPRLSPTCIINDHSSNPYVEEGATVGCTLHEGFYLWPEMRYRRSDLAKVGDFDIALTHERFDIGAVAEYKRAKVVSQRYYQYCLAHNLKAKWRPVRIEED